MHELGIIVHIAKTLDQVAAENELKKIGSVTLDIGEVSGIVPEYLTLGILPQKESADRRVRDENRVPSGGHNL